MCARDNCVYILKCRTTGLKYVGRTNDLTRRMGQHEDAAEEGDMTDLHKAIRKHRWNNFCDFVIERSLTLDEAKILEKKLIAKYNTFRGPGYNMTSGG